MSDSNALATASANDFMYLNSVNGQNVFVSSTQLSMMSGTNKNDGKSSDLVINVNATDLINNSIWINPNPNNRTLSNPSSNQYDFMSIATHELGHALGINGYRNWDGTIDPTVNGALSLFDMHITNKGTQYYFSGDNVNLVKLKKYIDATRLSEKIGGYADHLQQQEAASASAAPHHPPPSLVDCSHLSALRNVSCLLHCLMNSDGDGRVCLSYDSATAISSRSGGANDGRLQFVLFNPSIHFQKIVDAEWQIIYDKLDLIVKSGAKVVLSKLPIGDLATQYFADRDIFCAGRVPIADLERVAKATGG
jgi:hypothetical protein